MGRQPALVAAGGFRHIDRMLHLAKLAVGIRDIEHLAAVQAQRRTDHPPLRHLTRHFPRRAAEVIDGGSLFWVIGGAMLARQRVLDVTEDQREDGSKCAALVLDPLLVPVLGRPTKAFQGWRYLAAADAPPDRAASAPVAGVGELPVALRRALQELCLL